MLRAASAFAQHDVLVLGVNRGRLGFLTDISPATLEKGVSEVLDGQFIVEERFLLDAVLKRND